VSSIQTTNNFAFFITRSLMSIVLFFALMQLLSFLDSSCSFLFGLGINSEIVTLLLHWIIHTIHVNISERQSFTRYYPPWALWFILEQPFRIVMLLYYLIIFIWLRMVAVLERGMASFQIITAFLDVFFVCWIDSQKCSMSA